MIPCICSECKRGSEPYFYKYSLLQKCQVKEKKAVFCENSLEDIEIENLLKGVIMQKWDVFISYSSKDFHVIQKTVENLKNNNITYWLDDEQIKPGDSIIPKIEIGLDNSLYVMPCFSQNQLDSGWSRAEYQSILHEILSNKQGNRKIIPLIIDDLDPDKLPRLIKDILYTRLSDDREFRKLLDSLKNSSI